MELIFITHPQVNIDPKIPIDEWSLSDVGFFRSKNFLDNSVLKRINAIYSSEEQKAFMFAEMIADKYDLKNKKVDCLGEIRGRKFIPPEDFGLATKKWFDNPSKVVNGWETRNDAQERIVTCVRKIMSNYNSGKIAVVGHGGTGTLLKCVLRKWCQSRMKINQILGATLLWIGAMKDC